MSIKFMPDISRSMLQEMTSNIIYETGFSDAYLA